MSNVQEIDRWEPDYEHSCEVCGQSPTVTGVFKGKVVYAGDMCGVCTWGEAAMWNPENWNE